MQVGRYLIQVPGTNQLSATYAAFPDYSGHLGRLTTLLNNKYPGLTGLDIGANVGDTACIIKSAADIRLLCIEGDDLTFGLLEQNIRQFNNVSAYKMFLGEKTETISATLDKVGWNTTLIPNTAQNGKKIKIISLDDFLVTQSDTAAIKLVKIDTEGFDCSIIRGARKFLGRAEPVITFEYNRGNMDAIGEKGLDTLAMLSDLGYSLFGLHDASGRFFTMAPLSNDELIRDVHDYADGRNGTMPYYDFTLFHERDRDVAEGFSKIERARRAAQAMKTANSPRSMS
jgi:FkbM family methyltransferase